MTQLSSRSKELLAQYRAAQRPDTGTAQRMQDGLFDKIARGETPLANIDASAIQLPRASWLSRLAGSGTAKLSAALLVVAGGTALLLQRSASPTEPVRVAAHAPFVPPPPPAAPVVELPAEPEPQPAVVAAVVLPAKPKRARVRHAQKQAPVVSPAAVTVAEPEPVEPLEPEPVEHTNPHRVTSPLDSELGLLQHAYKELNAGRPASALAAVEEHAYRFANGELAEAREVARMLALCGLDREKEAKARAVDFLLRHPSSPFAGRVRGMCPLMLPKTEP